MLSSSDDDDDIDASRLTTTEYACAERGMQVMILAEFCVPARPTLETGSDCESDDDEYIGTLTKRRRVEDPMWLPFAIAVDNQIRSWGHHAHKKPSTPEIESIWDIPSGEFKLKVDCTRTAWQHMSDELHKLPAHIKAYCASRLKSVDRAASVGSASRSSSSESFTPILAAASTLAGSPSASDRDGLLLEGCAYMQVRNKCTFRS